MQESTQCRCGQPPTAARRNNVTGQLPLCLRCAAADRFVIKSSPRKDGPLPAHIQGTRTAAIHQGKTVYTHQAKSLETLAQGDNLVVATPTASGKTLIFHLHAFSMLEADPNARTLVLYPAKALANDQLDRWQAAAQTCDAGPAVIAQITGDVPTRDRTAILDHSRIILMTPDVLHAWLIRTATSPAQRRFLQHLRLVITDEAHVYEDVLGTNAAFMFRRLSAAANASSNQFGIQHLAATATILNPAAHMTQLTGLPFSEVTESDNGAPRQETTLYHVPPPSEDDSMEAAAAKMVVSIITADPGAQIIVFHDSRQGAERIAAHAARPSEVIPYRAGYLPNERREIGQDLRANKIRAIITTALEIGIDMPDLNYGINIGLPPTRKQCRQRMGRVGRSRDATFVILGDKNTFTRHGETMRRYYRNSVEETRLHLNNEYIAYQHAMCYLRESRGYHADDGQGSTPISWPPIFGASLKAATSADPPRSLAPSHARSKDTPTQLAYSLRSSGEETLEIIPQIDDEDQGNLGTINASSAIREAFPGALYRHRGTSYNVTEWGRRAGKPYVRVVPAVAAAAATTRPLTRRLAVLKLLTATSSCAGLAPYPGAYAHTHTDLWTSAEGYANRVRAAAAKGLGEQSAKDGEDSRREAIPHCCGRCGTTARWRAWPPQKVWGHWTARE